jgi:hypothetical protein
MQTLFFLHLQKTGGTSVRRAARGYFPGASIIMHYGKNSRWTSPAALEIMSRPGTQAERLKWLSDYIVANDIAFFASHMPATRLDCFDAKHAFTLVRDPVERVISQYFYSRSKGWTGATLAAFIEEPGNQNLQSRKLKAVDLETLGAVGVLERYDAFVDRLNKSFGLCFGVFTSKRGGVLKEVRSRLLSKDLRHRIAELNQEDIALYRRALELAP